MLVRRVTLDGLAKVGFEMNLGPEGRGSSSFWVRRQADTMVHPLTTGSHCAIVFCQPETSTGQRGGA